jgi:glycine/D-amino acid oxidase-like deaminating enzyme
MKQTYDVIIAGAGIAGVSAAYFLTCRQGIKNVLLVDPRPPLTLTTDNSTECYRNWWPGPDSAMIDLINRSIDHLETLADRSANTFNLNRRGYLYVTGNPGTLPTFIQTAQTISRLGGGPLRIHHGRQDDPAYVPSHPEGYHGSPGGADLFLEPSLIQKHFPGISDSAIAALHVRRAGWFSAQQLGMYLLEQALAQGAQVKSAQVTGLNLESDRITGVHLDTGEFLATGNFVNAAGPGFRSVGKMAGVNLPVHSELHLKVAIQDPLAVVDRDAPLLIWSDSQTLDWSAEERAMLADDPEMSLLLGDLPSGVHSRPEGGAGSQVILMLWEYHSQVMEPTYPLPAVDPFHAEIVLRGLCRLLPRMNEYLNRLPRPRIDGGYYIKTLENRPLIGKLPVAGGTMIGALSGFGLMAACGAGELLAAHVAGSELPAYAPAFSLERYDDPIYQEHLRSMGVSGQL